MYVCNAIIMWSSSLTCARRDVPQDLLQSQTAFSGTRCASRVGRSTECMSRNGNCAVGSGEAHAGLRMCIGFGLGRIGGGVEPPLRADHPGPDSVQEL
jgi:hypothetical protein